MTSLLTSAMFIFDDKDNQELDACLSSKGIIDQFRYFLATESFCGPMIECFFLYPDEKPQNLLQDVVAHKYRAVPSLQSIASKNHLLKRSSKERYEVSVHKGKQAKEKQRSQENCAYDNWLCSLSFLTLFIIVKAHGTPTGCLLLIPSESKTLPT